ncbi:MAG: type I DNA topoisomerase [Spirochaetales bacterium]|jgi:DNA topoisomerase-1|nr:type I DNA topoisomerase [Spirochaetales bacterium]
MKSVALLIVESPAKAKTIERYLGPGYVVAASMGHLIDLPRSRMGVRVEENFEPEYITVRGKAKILKDLQSKANKSNRVLLASDNDREGEAIAYHLKNNLLKKNKELQIERIVFNEITPEAIREAVAHPIGVDEPKVNAQKARRVLDRLVGYNLSPLLWKKVKNGLSAGRVQSVALRLICEREKEVEEFIPEEYWSLDIIAAHKKTEFSAQLVQLGNEKALLPNETAVEELIKKWEGKPAVVTAVRESEKKSNPRPPYTTSKLQQDAANRLGFTSRKTMQIAQQLYEGINIDSSRVGLITYMRTDSTRISNQALEEVRKYLGEKFPAQLPPQPQLYSVKKGAQDAHEAIRPTYVSYDPDFIKDFLNRDQFKLYCLIWERFVSSQMTPSLSRTVSVDIQLGEGLFRALSSHPVEEGYQRVLKLLKSKEKTAKLPALKPQELLEVRRFEKEQHYTTGPARFSDASIVKILEEKGIGRPSTYAPIISVLLDRYYVVRKNKQLIPTALGRIISNVLVNQFPQVLEVSFTARLEEELDEVEEDKISWQEMIKGFYGPFLEQVEHVNETMESIKGVLDEPTDKVCEKCGRPLIKKLGRFGFFLACSGFPDCRNTRAIPLAACPRPGCGGEIVARKKAKGRGKEFYGCTNYPECDFISHYKPTSSLCPGCGWFLVEKNDKKRGSFKVCINEDCHFLHVIHEEPSASGTEEGAGGEEADES